MTSKSYVMAAIRVMGRQRGRRFTIPELIQQLSAGAGGPIFPAWVATGVALRGVLGELGQFGFLQSDGETWWVPEGKGDGDDGDGGRGVPPPGGAGSGDGGGGDDDGRGGGLAEVLAHPVMFSSDDADFERALPAALTL